MIELYKPDMYRKSIYSIDFNKLKEMGIKCIIFDLDNTLSPLSVKKPSKKLKDYIESIKLNFKVIIMSNSSKNRVRPFKEKLDVDSSCLSFKPFKFKYKKILNLYKFNIDEVAVVGDQIPIDIYGGNKIGVFTILVDKISEEEKIWTKFNRFKEKKIITKLSNNNLFWKGKYYE